MRPATVTQTKALAMQVCVPATMTEAEIVTFAESQNPCGTMNGWKVSQEQGRAKCADDSENVHVVLTA